MQSVPSHRTFVFAVLVNVLGFIASLSTAQAKGVLGYYYDDQASYPQLTSYYPSLTQVATDAFTVTSQGAINGTVPTQAITFCNSNGIEIYACCSNFGATDWDASIAHAIVSNASVQTTFINNLYNLVRNNGYTGVNIDFEGMLATDRAGFSALVHNVAVKMHGAGYKLIVSVPPKPYDDPNDAWSGTFDFAAIGQDVDLMQLMTYDENGPWGSPGPVSGIDWVEPAVQYAVSVVPSLKVSMGLPAYGYDWDTTHNTREQVGWSALPGLIASTGATPMWDDTSASPYFDYQAADGSSHEVWYENTTSISRKVAFANTYNLAGVSTWAIGMTDQGFWDAISSVLESTVVNPVFSPAGGTFTSAPTVGITSSTVGAAIRYTTDGSAPTSTTGTLYTGAISIGSTTTLQAIAYKSGLADSGVTSATYVINPGGGVTATAGDGLHTTALSSTQTGTFTAQFDWVTSASPINSLVGLAPAVPTAYTGLAAIVRFNPSGLIDARNGGAYAAATSIPYSAGVSYHFRLLVNIPAHTYSAYVTPAGGSELTIGTNYAFRTEQAGATSLSYWSVAADPTPTGSTTVTNFSIGTPAVTASPAFSPSGGTYTSAPSVTITSATSGASIRYTLDGSTPTSTTGTVYSGPVAINATATLQAIAYASGMTNSSITTATYTINGGGTPAKFTIPAASVTDSNHTGSYVPANTVDGNLATRWAANGDGVWIQYDLGATKTVSYVRLAWYAGDVRTYTFDVQLATSSAGPWTTVVSRATNAANTALQVVDFADASARYVRVVGHLSSVDNYTNITEAEVWGY